MEKRNVNTNLVAALLIVVAVLGYGLIGRAGNLEPNNPPAPTMKTLQEIYDAVGAEGSGVSQREGFCKYVFVPAASTTTVIEEVPVGKRFVILKLFMNGAGDDWEIKVNGENFIKGRIVYTGYGSGQTFMWDFPDRCVVADAGDTITFVTGSEGHAQIIGYFFDVP
jgi:hypothetical protein